MIIGKYSGFQLLPFILSIFILVAFHISKAYRWRYILSIHKIKSSLKDSYLIYMSGLFVGILTPGRLGDFIKILYLKNDGVSTIKATFISFVDRIFDLGFLLLLGIFYTIFLSKVFSIQSYTLFMIVVSLLILFFAVKLLREEKIKKLSLKFVPSTYQPLFSTGFKELKSDFKNYNLITFSILTLLTVFGWCIYITVIYGLTKSINLPIPLFYVGAFFVFSTLVTFIPITVAGVGTRDLVLIAMFTRLGYLKEEAIAFSMLILIIYLLTALFGFVVWLVKPVKKIKK